MTNTEQCIRCGETVDMTGVFQEVRETREGFIHLDCKVGE